MKNLDRFHLGDDAIILSYEYDPGYQEEEFEDWLDDDDEDNTSLLEAAMLATLALMEVAVYVHLFASW